MTSWKDKLSPEALERKRERDRQRRKNGRGGYKTITIDIKEEQYINIWKSIPNKAEWFREQLDKYAEEHNHDKLER